MTTPINLTQLRADYGIQSGEHVHCPHCGEGYPAGYPHGLYEANTIILALIDTAEAAIAADNYAKRHGLRFNDRLRETLNHYVHTP
jgi:hypothetical protein